MHIPNPFRPSTAGLVPDIVPVLSPGRHRHPGKGACFMEMASYLAGERWSDHPHCTHPTLAALAREVNDHLDAEHRQRIVPMIPEVIDTASDDPRVPLQLSRSCALALLEVGSPRDGVAALALLHAEAALSVLDGLEPAHLTPQAQGALAGHPEAVRWARRFTGEVGSHRRTGSGSGADRRAALATVRCAVTALAPATGGQDRLVALLRQAIDLCRAAPRVPAHGSPTRLA